eukprot:10168405-Alexandrium_andersonii.AAC.1
MSASLVGSEMCIRDRPCAQHKQEHRAEHAQAGRQPPSPPPRGSGPARKSSAPCICCATEHALEHVPEHAQDGRQLPS